MRWIWFWLIISFSFSYGQEFSFQALWEIADDDSIIETYSMNIYDTDDTTQTGELERNEIIPKSTLDVIGDTMYAYRTISVANDNYVRVGLRAVSYDGLESDEALSNVLLKSNDTITNDYVFYKSFNIYKPDTTIPQPIQLIYAVVNVDGASDLSGVGANLLYDENVLKPHIINNNLHIVKNTWLSNGYANRDVVVARKINNNTICLAQSIIGDYDGVGGSGFICYVVFEKINDGDINVSGSNILVEGNGSCSVTTTTLEPNVGIVMNIDSVILMYVINPIKAAFLSLN